MTKNEKKAEVLDCTFASVFNGRTSCSEGTQPPELVNRDGEQSEAHTMQGETVTDLLHHLDTHRSMMPDGMQPEVRRELVEMLAEPFSMIYWQYWLEGISWLEFDKC